MRKHLHRPGVWIVALLLLALWLLWPRPASSPLPQTAPPQTAGGTHEPLARTPSAERAARATAPADVPALPAFLPAEARDTIALILRGGPYPYRQDDGVFGNREGHLPRRPYGYYREYTVDTPGADHRGARRIVTDGDPPKAWYYSDDHYDSFHAFDVHAFEAPAFEVSP